MLWQRVGHSKGVVKSVRPELDVEICTYEKCANCASKRAMTTFNWTVLMGIVSPSWKNIISFLLEKVLHFRMIEKLSALVHVDVFVAAMWVVLGKEVSAPL